MKTTILAAFAGAVLLSSAAFAKDASTTMKVGGWHCGGCAGKTETALKGVKGVKDAKADASAKTVTVTYDDAAATPADLEKAIVALNYKVEK